MLSLAWTSLGSLTPDHLPFLSPSPLFNLIIERDGCFLEPSNEPRFHESRFQGKRGKGRGDCRLDLRFNRHAFPTKTHSHPYHTTMGIEMLGTGQTKMTF
jgi:hypothetical protein